MHTHTRTCPWDRDRPLLRHGHMSRYTRPHMSEESTAFASRAFKCAALVAETYVFIYLGEAIFSFPILHNTVWRLVIVALLACALGRTHIFIGLYLRHLCARRRRRTSSVKSSAVKSSGSKSSGSKSKANLPDLSAGDAKELPPQSQSPPKLREREEESSRHSHTCAPCMCTLPPCACAQCPH